jgi:hypothetical protein
VAWRGMRKSAARLARAALAVGRAALPPYELAPRARCYERRASQYAMRKPGGPTINVSQSAILQLGKG